jgi:hypothetical protein
VIAIRRVALALAASAALAVAAAPANAAPPFKARYKPLDGQIHKIGLDIAKELQAAGKQNDQQAALALASLAQRAAKSAVQLQQLPGAKAAARAQQVKLATALQQGSLDLSGLAIAVSKHDAAKAHTLTLKLIKDSQPIAAARTALRKVLKL